MCIRDSHIRVNYALRALKIPAGQHKIEFKFDPTTYKRGELITLIFSILLLLGFGYVLYTIFTGKGPEEDPTQDDNIIKSEVDKVVKKPTIKSTKRKKK